MSKTVLSVEGVSKCYRPSATQRQIVLNDVSFTVAAGEIVAVDAPRRAGKTTLLNVVAGMKPEDSGVIRLFGSALSAKERNGLIGRDIGWLDRNGPKNAWRSLDYVALPVTVGGGRAAQRRGRERGLAALERVGAARCAAQQWDELADYERLLVSIARVYVQRPRLILADDLFDDLRVRGSVEAGDLLSSIVRELDCAVLASVSDAEAALFADRVLALQDGTLVIRSDQSRRADLRLVRPDGRLSTGTGP